MSFTRREFLKCCGRGMSAATMMTALGYAGLENAYAQGSDYKALVCIFLEGGNDGWNTIVPLGAPHSIYSSNRQGLALRTGVCCRSRSLVSARTVRFHPRLAGLRTLFNQGRVAVVNNVGNLLRPVTPQQVLANPSLGPSGLFDHFQQQTYSQSLRADPTVGWETQSVLNSLTSTPDR